MPRPAGSRNYAPLVRSWVFQILKENPDQIRDAIEKKILEDPIGSFRELSWLIPKELLIQQDVNHTVKFDMATLTPDLIQEALQARRAIEHDRPSDTGTDKPIH